MSRKPVRTPVVQGNGPAVSPIDRLADAAAREHQAGNLESAKQLYAQALSLDARHASSLLGIGLVAYDAGSYEIAEKMIRRAIAVDDTQPQYHACLGAALHAQKNLDGAAAAYERALELDPSHVHAWSDLGVVLRAAGKRDQARACCERALALEPRHAAAHNNLASLLQTEGDVEEAKKHAELALKTDPKFAEAHNTLGVLLRNLGHLKQARASMNRALALKPDYPSAMWNRCILDLQEGNYAQGWRDFEVRYRCGIKGLSNFPQPLWRGEPLDGASILLHAEQGFGDVIQFLRYVPMVGSTGARVILSVPSGMRSLAAGVSGVQELRLSHEAISDFDWHCPLMSLPHAFRTTLETIPNQTPYLKVPEEARKAADTLPWPENSLKVGLVWSGNPDHVEDKLRSIPLKMLEPLLHISGTRFYSLQVGRGESELDATTAPITNLRSAINDMADTAALLPHLDLVIAVDTAVAHLAGALGRPAWVLLPLVPDWRWLMERDDSPWYPTLRLFRQQKFREWQPVIQRVQEELEARVKQVVRV